MILLYNLKKIRLIISLQKSLDKDKNDIKNSAIKQDKSLLQKFWVKMELFTKRIMMSFCFLNTMRLKNLCIRIGK